jgi:hypothetical protein
VEPHRRRGGAARHGSSLGPHSWGRRRARAHRFLGGLLRRLHLCSFPSCRLLSSFAAESSIATRASTSFVAFFTTVTFVVIFFAATSLVTTASIAFLDTVAAAASVASLTNVADSPPPDPSGFITADATTFGLGCDAVAGFRTCYLDSGGQPTVDPSLRYSLFLLCRGRSSSDNTSVSLSMI